MLGHGETHHTAAGMVLYCVTVHLLRQEVRGTGLCNAWNTHELNCGALASVAVSSCAAVSVSGMRMMAA